MSKQGVDGLPHLCITWILRFVNLDVQLSIRPHLTYVCSLCGDIQLMLKTTDKS